MDDGFRVLRFLGHGIEDHVAFLLGNGQDIAEHADLCVGIAEFVTDRVPGPQGSGLSGGRVFFIRRVGAGFLFYYRLGFGDGGLAEVDLGSAFGQVLGEGQGAARGRVWD